MIDNNHLLEKMKEALIGSDLLSCVQKRVLLLLGEGVSTPGNQPQLFKGVKQEIRVQ